MRNEEMKKREHAKSFLVIWFIVFYNVGFLWCVFMHSIFDLWRKWRIHTSPGAFASIPSFGVNITRHHTSNCDSRDCCAKDIGTQPTDNSPFEIAHTYTHSLEVIERMIERLWLVPLHHTCETPRHKVVHSSRLRLRLMSLGAVFHFSKEMSDFGSTNELLIFN